jgi:hypothetical protein
MVLAMVAEVRAAVREAVVMVVHHEHVEWFD